MENNLSQIPEDVDIAFCLHGFKKLNTQDQCHMLRTIYSNLRTIYQPELEKVLTSQSFFNGDHYTGSEKSQMIESGRIPFVTNHIKQGVLKHIGEIKEEFQRSRFELPAVIFSEELGEESGKEQARILDIINKTYSYFYDKVDVPSALIEAERDSFVQGRALIQVCFDGTNFFLNVHDAIGSLISPACKKRDCSDCEFALISYTASKDKLISLYPEKADVINNSGVYIDQRLINQVSQPVYAGLVNVFELLVRDYDNIVSNGRYGNVYVITALSSSGEVLAIEPTPYSTFPCVLASPVINKTFSTIERKFLGIIEDVIPLQRQYNALNNAILDIVGCSANSLVVVYKENLENKDQLETLRSGVVYSQHPDVTKCVHRLTPNSIDPSFLQLLQQLSEGIYQGMSVTPPNTYEKSNEVVTASMLEIKDKKENKLAGYYRQALEETHKALAQKLIRVVLETAMYGEKTRLELLSLGIPEEEVNSVIQFSVEDISLACKTPVSYEDLERCYNELEHATVTFMNAIDSPTNKQKYLMALNVLKEFGYQVPVSAIISGLGIEGGKDLEDAINKASEEQQQMQMQMMQAEQKKTQSETFKNVMGAIEDTQTRRAKVLRPNSFGGENG